MKMRKHKKEGNRILSPKMIQHLDDIGFNWGKRHPTWESKFEQLVEYKEKHGDCEWHCSLLLFLREILTLLLDCQV